MHYLALAVSVVPLPSCLALPIVALPLLVVPCPLALFALAIVAPYFLGLLYLSSALLHYLVSAGSTVGLQKKIKRVNPAFFLLKRTKLRKKL